MPEVWLIRHAPAAGNLDGTFMGQLDSEPDPGGLAQAAALAGTIAADVVLCSPLRRAALTAAALFPSRAVTHDPRLAERHLGEWQGRSKAEMRARRPQDFTDAGTLDLRATPPGGEPLADFQARVHAILSEIAALPADRRVAVVSHNGVLLTARVLLGLTRTADAARTPEPFARPDLVVIDERTLASPAAAGAISARR